MYSIVSFCLDAEKTDEFSRRLIDIDGQIWWGLHAWQDVYKPSGFNDSVRKDGDPIEHWHDALAEYRLQEMIDPIEV